ncbi:hypothetical protein ACFS32_01470 [Novosphingobium pokkalii]
MNQPVRALFCIGDAGPDGMATAHGSSQNAVALEPSTPIGI